MAPPSSGPSPLELWGPFADVPSLEEIGRLTGVPERRVVFRGVDWAFYDRLVDSIPESSNIHVDYDGKDLEVMGKRRKHESALRLMRLLIEIIARESGIPFGSAGATTWKRPEVGRGLEADECYYFLSEKIAADREALKRKSDNIADYPNPDLAVEVDLSPPQVDREGIYSALRVAEVWRFDGQTVVIERLAADGTYIAEAASGFLPVSAEEVRRWLVDEDGTDEEAWESRLRAEFRKRAKKQAKHRGKK
jgi:Uma2 family endonuclease